MEHTFNCLYHYSHIYIQGVSCVVPLSTAALLRRSVHHTDFQLQQPYSETWSRQHTAFKLRVSLPVKRAPTTLYLDATRNPSHSVTDNTRISHAKQRFIILLYTAQSPCPFLLSLTKTDKKETWGFPNGVLWDSSLQRCYAVSLGEWLPAFRRIVVPLSSRRSSQSRKDYLGLEDEGTRMIRNVGNYSPNGTP